MRGLVFFAIVLFCTRAMSEQVKVVKVAGSGRRAIVVAPAGTMLRPGQMLNVDGGSGGSGGGSTSGWGFLAGTCESRKHSIAASASLASASTSAGGGTQSTTAISVSGRYGWNDVKQEYGPIVQVSTVSGNQTTTTLAVGGFYDYNLVPNEPGQTVVYGIGGLATLGTSTANGASGSTMTFFGGGFLKWFPFAFPVAIRSDLGLQYDKNSASNATTTTILAMAGFETYF